MPNFAPPRCVSACLGLVFPKGPGTLGDIAAPAWGAGDRGVCSRSGLQAAHGTARRHGCTGREVRGVSEPGRCSSGTHAPSGGRLRKLLQVRRYTQALTRNVLAVNTARTEDRSESPWNLTVKEKFLLSPLHSSMSVEDMLSPTLLVSLGMSLCEASYHYDKLLKNPMLLALCPPGMLP
ncbi:hypothetical protein NDU88_001742 [Pleurodeles waltl]|uniref:Uncharacterized protein n=1 Tax=Pleurodeles waltl TaxID=8319 RepID=A0AAV7Q814_PLEWA|nr:hypothetical protein NDU88_001742 [Pleurodeles waltl]